MTRENLLGAMMFALISAGCANKPASSQETLDRKFEEMVKGVTLVGRSSSLQCCGSSEVPVPIPVTIEWAGDTPVITLTDLSIPGMGTYTARVVLHRDQYAGTWSGKKRGGQVFGKIVRNK